MQKFNCIILFFIGFIPFSAQADEVLLAPVSAVSKGYAADILETPSAVTVLERENLFEKGGQNLGDVLRKR